MVEFFAFPYTMVRAWFTMVFVVWFTILPRYTFNYLGKCMVHIPGVKQAAQYTPVYHIGYHGMLCSSIGYTVAKVGLPSLVYCSMYDLPHYERLPLLIHENPSEDNFSSSCSIGEKSVSIRGFTEPSQSALNNI